MAAVMHPQARSLSQGLSRSQSQLQSEVLSQSQGSDKENYESISGGWIMSMKLENFMCHRNLEVDFIPRVNFITGQNGSGKSAILTGLVVAFGSRARGTQRATSMKDLIRNGCSHATIRVELCNRGGHRVLFNPYKPEIFGDKIIVEKRIDCQNSSKLLLRDVRGHVVSSRKEDLEEIIMHFNIDVTNPCLVMTQDKSRQFLHSNGPGDKFQFFLKATQLKQLMEKLERIDANVTECIDMMKSVWGRITQFKESLKALDDELQAIRLREEGDEQVALLKAQWVWAKLYDLEDLLRGKEAEEEQIRQQMDQCEAQMQADADAVRALVAERDQNVQAMNVASEEYKRLQEELENFRAEWRAAKQEYIRNKNVVTEIQAAKKELEANIQRKKDMVAELLRSAQEESQVNQSQRASDIEAKQRQMTELRASIDEMHHQIHNTKSEQQEKDRELSRAKSQLEECEKDLHQVHGWMQRLRSNQRDTIMAFGGDNVRKLMALIEQRRREFSQPPIGPLGVHVKLATQEAEKWSKLVEVVLDNHLNSFLAASTRDAQLLSHMARSLNMHVSVHTFDFNLPRIQPPPQELPDASLTTVLRVLECPNSVVHNALIDMANVEAIVLVDTFEEGKRVAYDRRAPWQIKEVLTLSGDRLSLNKGQEVARPLRLRNVRPRLTRDRAAQARQAQAEAAQLEETQISLRAQVKERLHDLQQVQGRCNQLERAVQRREMELKGMHHEMRELRAQAAAEEEDAQVNMADLEVDIQNLLPELEDLQRQDESHGEQMETAKQALAEVEAKKPRLLAEAEQFQKAKEAAEAKLGQSTAKRQELDQRIAHLEETRQRLEEGVAQVESDRASLAEEVAVVKRKASEYCPEETAWPPGSKRIRADKVERKVHRLQQALQEQDEQDQIRSPEDRQQRRAELEEEKKQKLKTFQTVEARATLMRSRLKRVKESLRQRNDRVNQSAHFLAKQLNWEFMNQLHGKNFTGKVDVNYEEGKLYLEVNTGKGTVTDVRSMSGGERSFATLAFALALHGLAEAPFRAMDEFDIFMDNVTRNMCLKQAVGFALESRSQWIFITPHDISDVQPVEGSVKKMMLQAPRGNQ